MPSLVFAYPGDLNTPTGGYGYDRRIIAGLRTLGWDVDLVSLGEGFPFPADETLRHAEYKLSSVPEGSLVVVDGLALGVMSEAMERLHERIKLVALVHHPLCLENGLSKEQSEALFQSENSVLAFARHIIVTSPATGTQVEDLFGIAPDRITAVLPGTDKPEPFERQEQDTIQLLAVGTLLPRKGYDLLLSALASLKALPWHLDIVGGLEADPACYQALLAQVRELDLSGRVTFHGAVQAQELAGFFRSADIFVLASRYEGYGMAYTEALAYGLPVIGSGGGAVKETLPEGAAIYCGVEDVDALRRALEALISDQGARDRLSAEARKAAERLPDWTDAARQFANLLEDTSQ
ncbi:glycosyltransferase family 4 protein [Stappia sp. BW2]|uniref:glycosyltransferase family 4 protein n=1 Tax=Stappia sp. BW2 TaxID=2592622 RepID=UPI0011DEDCD1|nr:glycosyltransferase family 4 protein [Stappia sp. BW2]TYC67382.1 glycosyltransferase family 4 protein [Stappia sp. BW2]